MGGDRVMSELILGFLLGMLFILYFVVGCFVLDKRKYTCTESAIINGVAECVKYERKVEK